MAAGVSTRLPSRGDGIEHIRVVVPAHKTSNASCPAAWPRCGTPPTRDAGVHSGGGRCLHRPDGGCRESRPGAGHQHQRPECRDGASCRDAETAPPDGGDRSGGSLAGDYRCGQPRPERLTQTPARVRESRGRTSCSGLSPCPTGKTIPRMCQLPTKPSMNSATDRTGTSTAPISVFAPRPTWLAADSGRCAQPRITLCSPLSPMPAAVLQASDISVQTSARRHARAPGRFSHLLGTLAYVPAAAPAGPARTQDAASLKTDIKDAPPLPRGADFIRASPGVPGLGEVAGHYGQPQVQVL